MREARAVEPRTDTVVERRARQRQRTRFGRVEDEASERRNCVRASAIRTDELQVDRRVKDGGERVVPGDGRAAPARGVRTHGVGHVAEGVAARESGASGAGFELARRVRAGKASYCTDARNAQLRVGVSFWSVGVPWVADGASVDYEMAERGMDPRDREGAAKEPPTTKAARSYVPIPWEPERWDIGLPRELDEMMARRGVGIYPWAEDRPTEVPFYPWASDEGLLKSIAEADRAIPGRCHGNMCQHTGWRR
jgi:hypothetical protein